MLPGTYAFMPPFSRFSPALSLIVDAIIAAFFVIDMLISLRCLPLLPPILLTIDAIFTLSDDAAAAAIIYAACCR